MWKQLLELFRQVLTLTEDTRQNRAEIKELRKQVDELTATVQRLVYEIHRVGERETHERDKFMLRVENSLLKANRQLPPDQERRMKNVRRLARDNQSSARQRAQACIEV